MNIKKIREALELSHKVGVQMEWDDVRDRCEEAIAELDKAQPLAEPVAWMVRTRIGVEWVTTLGVTETGARQIAIERYRNGSDVQNMDPIPIYAHPPQAQQPGKVLTDEEIERISIPEQWESEDYVIGGMQMGLMIHKRDRLEAQRIVKYVLRYARDNGYLAPAAGLTVEEAYEAACKAYNEYSADQAPMTWGQYLRACLNEKLNTKNQ